MAEDDSEVVAETEEEELDDDAKVYDGAITFGKGVAGMVRFVFEDILSGIAQGLYLVKKWHDMGWSEKLYTMASICAGLACSLLGPLMECYKMYSKGYHPSDLSSYDDIQTNSIEDINVMEAQSGADYGSSDGIPEQKHWFQKHWFENRKAQKDNDPEEVLNISISLRIRSQKVRNKLRIATMVYWVTMAALPFIFEYTCDEGLPKNAFLLFFFISSTSTFMEIWITAQTKCGYQMFKRLSSKFVSGIAFGKLGHFDTFSDVTQAAIMKACSPITWVTIKGYTITLPTDLATIMCFIVIVGVFIFQAIPGMILLYRETMFPVAFKLNEYGLLLATAQEELLMVDFASEVDLQGRIDEIDLADALGLS